MSMQEVRSLREALLQFYDSWAPYPAAEGLLRVHLGGWVASAASEGTARDLLHAALLYAHEVVVHDPVAAYFEPGRRRLRAFEPVRGRGLNTQTSSTHLERTVGFESFYDNLDAHRSHLSLAIPRVGALASLIREGIVVPIPHLKLALQRQPRIWTAVRYLLADDEYTKLVDTPVDRPALTQDEGTLVQFLTPPATAADARVQQYGDAAYYLSRSIAMADASYASYMPPSGTEWAIYDQRLKRLGTVLAREHKLELTVGPALLQSKLPYFSGLLAADVRAVRSSEEAFELWRTRLRGAASQIASLPSEGQTFVDDARDVLKGELDEAAAEVRQSISRTAALKRNLRPTALTVGTGAAGIAALGRPAALGGVAITGMLRWLVDSLLAPNLSGSKAVLAHLLQPPGDDGDDWPKREPLVITPKNRAGA
jgi:hypothetical protein